MSWTGKCPACGHAAMVENATGISQHRGPAFDRWRRAMAASVGGVLLDEARDTR